jgi:LuxR family maltose regulon positive regulatory protein
MAERLGLQAYVTTAGVLAACACIELERGEREAARTHLQAVVSLLPRSTAFPWLSILLAIISGRVAVGLGDLALSESLLAQARRDLSRYPDAGTLPQRLLQAERAYEAARGGAGALREPLTEAEMRILELAPTHLTLEEIARRLHISRNTVKTHLKGIYGKLDATSRNEAVARANSLGLLRRPHASED